MRRNPLLGPAIREAKRYPEVWGGRPRPIAKPKRRAAPKKSSGSTAMPSRSDIEAAYSLGAKSLREAFQMLGHDTKRLNPADFTITESYYDSQANKTWAKVKVKGFAGSEWYSISGRVPRSELKAWLDYTVSRRSNPGGRRRWMHHSDRLLREMLYLPPQQVSDATKRSIQAELDKRSKSNPRGSKGKFERCVKSVAARGGAYDPRAVCGAMEKKWLRQNPKPIEATYAMAHAAARDAANRKMRAAGRTSWSRADYNEATRVFNKLYPASKRNPAAGAIAVSEEFHGRKVGKMVPVSQQRHFHKYLAELGELTKLVVLTRDGRGKVTLSDFGGAMLTCNEAKDQLFITGGDQKVNPRDFGIDKPHEVETLGEVVTIEYYTDKHHLGDEGGTATYVHKFRSTNENGKHVTVRTARNPDLIYHKRDKHLEFSGGSYLIRKEGIDL